LHQAGERLARADDTGGTLEAGQAAVDMLIARRFG
jgi:hypothetical protein